MMVRTTEGDLALTADGVTFRRYSLHGKGEARTWRWDEVRRVVVEDVGRRSDAVSLAWGLVGWLFRSRHSAVIVSLDGGDVTFLTRQSSWELRAQVARLADDVPGSRGKVRA